MPHAEEVGARGVDLEIWEPLAADLIPRGAIRPFRVKINGVEVLTPGLSDELKSIVALSDMNRKDCLTATITMFVRSVIIHAKAPDATS